MIPLRRPSSVLLPCAVLAVVLSGCSSSSSSSSSPSSSPSSASSSRAPSSADPDQSTPASPLLGGLDVCRLPSTAQVRSVTGIEATATTRRLTLVPGYAGPVDVCGFGPSFESSTFSVAVGLAGATRADVVRQGGRAVDVGAAGRARQSAEEATVRFLKGTTLVQLRADRVAGEPSPLPRLLRAARQVADQVPAAPPPDSRQTAGRCAGLAGDAVAGVLGATPQLSRSLAYADRSAECSWATGVRRPRTLAVTLYTSAQAGPFFAQQRTIGPSTDVPGVLGDAFTTGTAAYVVAEDGQAAVVSGRFGAPPAAGRPLAVTPELTALLRDVAAQLT